MSIVIKNKAGGVITPTSATFEQIPNFKIEVGTMYRIEKPIGNLVYEYNPFKNLRYLDKDILTDKDRETLVDLKLIDSVTDSVKSESNEGKLIPFRTNRLGLDLKHNVEVEVQPSYDGSVNVICTDDKNQVRMINSRFTARENDTYEIIDRAGENDTNIYDIDSFDNKVSLYKRVSRIPKLDLVDVEDGGNMPVGNYSFYFKFADEDGNETDILAESSIVSCAVGSYENPSSVRGGIGDENSYKYIKFNLDGIDQAYSKIIVYYARHTSDDVGNSLNEIRKISDNINIISDSQEIIITGFENSEVSTEAELNLTPNILSTVKTMTQAQNRLFLANVTKPAIPYRELEDLSLRIYPTALLDQEHVIGAMNESYNPITHSTDKKRKNGYYNPNNIYYRTSYWDKEIYRTGIVYVMPDFSLSPTFPVRGRNDLTAGAKYENSYTLFDIYETSDTGDKKRIYVDSDNEGGIVGSGFKNENTEGVIRMLGNGTPQINDNGILPLGIKMNFGEGVVEELKKHTIGYFFVRQKRIPTIIGQGLTMGVDSNSGTPMPLIKDYNGSIGFYNQSFINKTSRLLKNDISAVGRLLPDIVHDGSGILCPEAQQDEARFNAMISGGKFPVSKTSFQPDAQMLTKNTDLFMTKHLYNVKYNNVAESSGYNSPFSVPKMVNVPQDTVAASIDNIRYCTKAGSPDIAYDFEFLGSGVPDKTKDNDDLVRGNYASFIGCSDLGYNNMNVDIHIPGYSTDDEDMDNYFKIRYKSNQPFYPISERNTFDNLESKAILYGDSKSVSHDCFRGDCFINQYTTRMLRNFQDSSAPTNDKIINPTSWLDNYLGYGSNDAINTDKIKEINRGDVNAVKLGYWITQTVKSTINLSMRNRDASNTAEKAMVGSNREYYPLRELSTSGEYKIPDSTQTNSAYGILPSMKTYFNKPDVPVIKQIFDNRIVYSEKFSNDGIQNGLRVYKPLAFSDYNSEYGFISKIIGSESNLIVIFEKGVGLLPINEKTVAGGGESGAVYIDGLNVLSNKIQPISDTYGTMWPKSVIKTPSAIYGVDTVGKRIWVIVNGMFKVLSDFSMNKFLNTNLLLGERDKEPFAGIKDVRTHYNAYKKDVIFTFYNGIDNLAGKTWSICYNEVTGKWTTRYTWIPYVMENINNIPFSFNRESVKNISYMANGYSESVESDDIVTSQEDMLITNNQLMGVVAMNGDMSFKDENNLYNDTTKEYFITPGYKISDKSLSRDYLTTELFRMEVGFRDSTVSVDPTSCNLSNYPSISDECIGYYDVINGDYKSQKGMDLIFTIKRNPDLDIPFDHEIFKKIGIFEVPVSVNIRSSRYNPSSPSDIIKTKTKKIVFRRDSGTYNGDLEGLISTDFWKHGFATTQATPAPGKWYGKQEDFEIEFIVVDNPFTRKILYNLAIISNKTAPSEFTYTIEGESYDNKGDMIGQSIDFRNDILPKNKYKFPMKINDSLGEVKSIDIDSEYYTLTQKARDIGFLGRVKGNMQYLRDIWEVAVSSISIPRVELNSASDAIMVDGEFEEARLRDKYFRIKIKYSDENAARVSGIITIFDEFYG